MFGTSRDMGIDLGTANTLVYIRHQGVVLQEPSVIAIDAVNKNILAVGREAQQMVGRTPGDIVAIRPMKDGVIADFEITERMLQYFINKARKRRGILRYRLVVGVPSGSTPVEKRAVIDAARGAGAREVIIIEEPMAAAIGAGLPVHEAKGNMIVDIGGGTTDVAVISLGGIVASSSTNVAGDAMDQIIIQYIRRKYNVLIGERTAEEIKCTIGTAIPDAKLPPMSVRGRDLVRGLPTTFEIYPNEIYEALSESISHIIDAVKSTLERTPPELMSDIMSESIVLAGGGALLHGLAERMARETGVRVRICDDPLLAVALGTGKALGMLDMLKRSNAMVG